MLETIARVFWVIAVILFGFLVGLTLAILSGLAELCELPLKIVRYLRRRKKT